MPGLPATIPFPIDVIVWPNISSTKHALGLFVEYDPVSTSSINDEVTWIAFQRSEIETRQCWLFHELAENVEHRLLPVRWQALDRL